MEMSVRLSNACGHIRLRPYVFVLSLLSVFFACVGKQNGVTVEESIPKGTEKPVTSVDLTPDPLTKILNLKQDKPSFNIDIWTDKKRYRAGEVIRFFFRTDRDCYLTLIDYETSGAIKVLFPNLFHQSNYIKEGRTYSIFDPESEVKLTVEPPTGIEKVKAIATTEPLSFFDLDFAKNCFASVERGNHRDMRSMSMALDSLPEYTWTENICTISIR
jgi:hypothetical protein